MKILITSISVLVLMTSLSFGQIASSEQDVYDAKELTFYGYDFSHLKLAETKRLGQDLSDHLLGWTAFCQERITDEKLAIWFKKEKVTTNITPTIELTRKIDGKEVVSYAKQPIDKDSLQSFVSAYRITEKNGVGFSVILECFDKVSDKTSGYFVFFDIATKKILLADYFIGKEVDGFGLTQYWGNSILGTTKNYASSFRKKVK